MSWDFKETMFAVLGGMNTLDAPGDIDQDPKRAVLMAQAQNVFAPTDRYDLMTRPGMTDVRATAINAAAVFTGMHWQSDLADRFLLWADISGTSHKPYVDSANPPTAIAGGTDPTDDLTNLVSCVNFTDGTTPMTVCAFRKQDAMQSINNAGTRADFTPTSTVKASFLEVFGQRLLFGAPLVSAVAQNTRVYWSDIRNGLVLTDPPTQFESFESEQGGNVLALHKLSEICMVGLLNNVFLLAPSPAGTKPFALRELPGGRLRGPIGHQAVTEGLSQLFWMGQTNIHSLDLTGQVKDLADKIKPTIAGLKDSARALCWAGYDQTNDLALFSVRNGTDTTNKHVIAVNAKTGNIYLWTLSVAAMAQRLVSSKNRLILGGYVGKFRNWAQGATGDLDDASAVIDADVFTPRHHMGEPATLKLFAGVKLFLNPQNTGEALTLQYRLNDASTWSNFAASPYTVAGTAFDVDTKFLPLMKAGTHLQLRFRNNTSAQIYRVHHYSIFWKPLRPFSK